MKRTDNIIPIPVDDEIREMINAASEKTGLSKSNIMRFGLRHGVPDFVGKIMDSKKRRKPACLKYLDEYPVSPVTARDAKNFLKKKLSKKYGSHC